MSRKDKKIILIVQCLVNPYCRVHILGQNFDLTHELMDFLTRQRVGIIQYLCPETTAMGLMRNPQGRQQYDNTFFRKHCKELLQTPMLMVQEFLKNGYSLVGFIGLAHSPTCGTAWGKHKKNKHQTESINPVENPSPNDPVLKGIMVELIADAFDEMGVKVPLLDLPAKEPKDSPLRQKFWEDLQKAISEAGK